MVVKDNLTKYLQSTATSMTSKVLYAKQMILFIFYEIYIYENHM